MMDRETFAAVAGRLAPEVSVYPPSPSAADGGWLAAGRQGRQRRIVAAVPLSDVPVWFHELSGQAHRGDGVVSKVAPYDHAGMGIVRRLLPFLTPQAVGLQASFGMGDRIGLATPGHVAAGGRNPGIRLVLAQQSIREMQRTGRTPQEVMDDAAFGAWAAGHHGGFGADADHLKTPEDITLCLAAGFVMLTIDPSAFVDAAVDADPPAAADAKYTALDGELPIRDLEALYQDKTFGVPRPGRQDLAVRMDRESFRRAVVKYGRAIAHAVRMARHAESAARGRPYEIELSVDETAKPTSLAEHYFIAAELRRAEVGIISLAPRFVGEFEKGIDYKGNLEAFEASLADHCAIARHFGPYKISVHSGSDKFSIYPVLARLTRGLCHVKTAGTSYLEALRAIARCDAPLFREIVGFARERYDRDKATYHVSAELHAVADPARLDDLELERTYLDADDGRQVLHVTFGSVLTSPGPDGSAPFRQRITAALWDHERTHWSVLQRHLGRHIELLAPAS